MAAAAALLLAAAASSLFFSLSLSAPFRCFAALTLFPTRRSLSDRRPRAERKAINGVPGSQADATRFAISRAVFFFDVGPPLSIDVSFRSSPQSTSPLKNHPQVLSYDIDLLHPPAALEARKHKLKRLVQSPNSYFMDVKCQGCFQITVVFSNSQTVVVCPACSAVLCTPTGGRARLTEGCSFRKKGD